MGELVTAPPFGFPLRPVARSPLRLHASRNTHRVPRLVTKGKAIMHSDHVDCHHSESPVPNNSQRHLLALFGGVVSACVVVFLLTVLGSSLAEAAPCGGDGQRACCGITGEGAPCPGITEVNGCAGDCLCGGTNPLGFSSNSHCVAAIPCGGEGQRACCGGQGEGAPCAAGLTEVNGCAGGSCICGGASNPLSVSSNSTCIKATPCGGEGQRACCGGELVNGVSACQPGLQELPFSCSGDCLCGGSANPFQISSSGTCVNPNASTAIAEPPINWTAPSAGPACGLSGYADMHAHMFGELAHGGQVLAGKAYDPNGGASSALSLLGDFSIHGAHVIGPGGLLQDSLGIGTQDGALNNFGAPYFTDWPTWTTTTHQQMYYRWLERAYHGGLRLMVMLAVTNEALCLSKNGINDASCRNSMLPPSQLTDLDQFDNRFQPLTATPPSLPPIERQLQRAYQFEDFIDQQAGGTGLGWFRIVKTPAEARSAISAGKLAVVLGIEVDHPFGCRDGGPCTEQTISDAVDKYYAKGVRHLFPVHNFDNQFGHPAAWQDGINVGNRVATGHWWSVEDCGGQGYGFKFSNLTQFFIGLLGFGGLGDPGYPSNQISCHAQGLTPLGTALLNKLKDKGMIIDIDHMSNKSLDATLTWAEANDYPVVASHGLFFELHNQTYISGESAGRHERLRTLNQLTRIKNVGGMVTVMLKDDVQDTGNKGKVAPAPYQNGTVPQNCIHSTKTLADALQYAVDKMGGPVAFGSDFNGIAGHIGPRFGTDACGGDGAVLQEIFHLIQLREGNKLQYPFTLPGFGTFDKQVTGKKTFDFNVDGLAHVGLLPDMVKDLLNIGVDADDIFNSAEGYVKVWEKAEGGPGSGSSTTAQCVNQTVDADATCKATASIATEALRNNPAVTLSQAPAGPYNEGTTSVTLTVTPTQSCDGPTSCTGTVTVVDKTPPSITCPANVTTECTGSSSATASFANATVGADNCNGTVILEGCSPTSGSSFALGNNTVTCSARDDATPANQGSCNFTVTVQDTTKPSIACPAPATIECTGNRSASFTPVAATAADSCAGVTVSNPPTATFPLGTTTLNYGVIDAVGLSAACTSSVTVTDTTKPVITSLSASPASLWPPNHKMKAITVSATATDVCSSSPSVCQITGISSNEPENGLGDGDTAPDWQITGPLTANLRAERSGTGTGRIYTLQVMCTDQQGLSTVGATTVTVAHDQGN
jgi:microsomal dipeptidase-like Zn-dependent dipeptidase